ncbi:hypothetical protein [Mycobacterium sp. 852014-52144_SCH5372336]|uniref:hypothetical protein n=1 Tax=Mycobacterium sp. 852014-52144_SCH5372336 TaxID=1834115 RepID=UPI0012E7E2D2|nr:hypothetical protein [Mycobacterium sp. 852014-52144_SCH5372336]
MLASTFDILREWQKRTENAYVPLPDSALAEDAEGWPFFPVSTVAWSGLIAASDHLSAIRSHIEARDLFPLAHLTLCRSALVGAAQATWVLAPNDRQERVRRGRTVASYLYKYHLNFLRKLQGSSDEPHIGTDAVAALVEQRRGELRAIREADDDRSELNTTEMIESAAWSAFAEQKKVDETLLAWQGGSGAAHGQPWPLFGTPGTVQKSVPADGLAEFQAGGSLVRIGNYYMAAFYLTEHAWTLFERRCAIAMPGPPTV